MPLELAISTSEQRLALAKAPGTVSEWCYSFLPIKKGRMAFAQRLLSSGTLALLRNTVSLGH
jgi:hypothetical protein